jgi:predicted transcriptional regulator
VQIGIDDAEAGEVFPSAEIEAKFAALREASYRDLPTQR